MHGSIKARRQLLSRKRRFIIMIVLSVMLVAALITLPIIIFGRGNSFDKVKLTSMQPSSPYASDASSFFFARDSVLHCIDSQNRERWSVGLFSEKVWLAVSRNAVAAYDETAIHVYDREGAALFECTFQQAVCHVACSKNRIAVLLEDEEGVFSIFVTDLSGQTVDTITDVPGRYVMDIGFFGEDSLYALALDTSGASPISCISTYKPGQAVTGVITSEGQLIEKLILTNDGIYAIGTSHMIEYAHTGEEISNLLIYGWQFQSYNMADGAPVAALAPRSQLEEETRISTMRIVALPDYDMPVFLPPGCLAIVAGKDKFFCFTKNTAYAYNNDGILLKSYELPIEVDNAYPAMDGTAVVLIHGEECHISPLP